MLNSAEHDILDAHKYKNIKKFSIGVVGGAMMLGKLPVPGRPTYLDNSRARAYCACNWCGWGLFGHFFLIYDFFFLSPSLWETARYGQKYCLKGPLSPKQPTNQGSGKPKVIFILLINTYMSTIVGI